MSDKAVPPRVSREQALSYIQELLEGLAGMAEAHHEYRLAAQLMVLAAETGHSARTIKPR